MSTYLKSFNPVYAERFKTIYRIGNKKIGNDTLIFNIRPAHMCEGLKSGMCQLEKPSDCYAYQDEQRYKNTRFYRSRQHDFFNSDAFIHVFISDMEHVKNKYPGIKYVRFNEAGEVHTKQELLNLSFIASWLKRIGITAYMYTCRKDIMQSLTEDEMEYVNSTGLVINGSGFMVHNAYIINKVSTHGVDCMGSCIHCVHCKRKGYKIINTRMN